MKKGITLFLLAAIIGLPVFAGGGGQNRGGAAGTAPRYSIMIALWSPEPPTPNAPVWQALNKLAGVTLDLQHVPSDSYSDKLSVSIAAGELPHSFCVLDNKGSAFISAVKAGMFWDVGDLVPKSKNISQFLDPAILKNAAIDGKNYFIPRTRVTTRTAFNYRKDWLEKLNLKIPETLEETYDVIKAFTTRDPDGNGRNDTYGLITAAADDGLWGFGIPAVANGAGNNWIEKDGRIVPAFMTQEHFDMVKFFKRLYDEKLINQDFATIRQEKGFELLNAEQGGMFFGNSDEITSRFTPLVSAKQAVDPKIQLDDLWDWNAHIKAPDGSIRIPGGSGFYGGFVFPKTTVKTEAELQTLFNIFDAFDSDVGKNLINWGVEGENYEIRNGRAIRINEATFTQNVQTFQQIAITGYSMPGSLKGEQPPIFDRYVADQIANQKYAIMDPTYPYISPTYTARNVELRKIVADAMIQYIMGQINDAQYQAAIERWRTSGGQQIIDEYTDAWKGSSR
jgi:putative aldouronate transport system substrate-binding protein